MPQSIEINHHIVLSKQPFGTPTNEDYRAQTWSASQSDTGQVKARRGIVFGPAKPSAAFPERLKGDNFGMMVIQLASQ